MYNARDHLNCLPPVTCWSCYSAEPWCLLGVQEEQVSVPGSLVGDRLSHWLVQGRCPSFFSETAFQFHLNIKMIQNAWSTKASHGDSRGLIQHSSFCHYGHSKLCFRWAMERLGTPVRNARNIAETVSTVRRWELSLQALKTIQNHQWTQWVVYWTIQLCFMGSWPSTYSWPYKRLICPASWSNLERATKSWRFYTCGDHSWQESIW